MAYNQPCVSIITVCLNSEKHIRQTIESVLNQTYKNIEYIIIDGCSKDKTIGIIKEYKPLFEGRMKWVSEPDSGIYDAMNKGIRMANGEWIGILNSDDWYETDAIQSIVKTANLNPEAEIIHGNINCVGEKGEIISIGDGGSKFETLLVKGLMPVSHPATFVKKEVYDSFGLFSLDYKIASDYEFILRCNEQRVKFFYINKILTNFRITGVSNTNVEITYKESFVIKKKYSKTLKEKMFLMKNIISYKLQKQKESPLKDVYKLYLRIRTGKKQDYYLLNRKKKKS